MMPIFVLFVFGAVLLGAGAMIAPAWPTSQPRVGLGAAFSLAIIVGGTVFYASLFGWDVLVIDYLLFALVVGIFLGGTLSAAEARAEARGEDVPADSEQGWTGPQDLAFFAVVALLCAAPVLILPAPLGDDAITYGYLSLVTRFGGTFDTFAPFTPEIEYLYAPGFSALTAYLSQQLNQSILTVQFSVGAVLALLNVWTAYDMGAEIRNKRLGRAMAITMLASLALLSSVIYGHYPALLGLLFAQAFIIFALRYQREGKLIDLVSAGLMLGAVMVSHPGMTITVLLGYVPWLATMGLAATPPSRDRWLVMALGIPMIAVIATAPWLADIAGSLGAFSSPLERSVDNFIIMIQYHGWWILPVGVLGAWLGWQSRDLTAILAIGWLFLILDFSTTGGIAAMLPFVDRFVNPLDIAWHGPIIPYTILGGMGLLWLWQEMIQPRMGSLSYRGTYAVAGVSSLVILGAIFAGSNLASLARTVFGGDGVLVTEADIEAAWWLREQSQPVTLADGTEDESAVSVGLVLNYPASSGLWVPNIAEADALNFPRPPYATSTGMGIAATVNTFWDNPTDAGWAERLQAAQITHIVLPHTLAAPDADAPWFWGDGPAGIASLEDIQYLTPIYEVDGVPLIYAVSESE